MKPVMTELNLWKKHKIKPHKVRDHNYHPKRIKVYNKRLTWYY